ncbi:innexin inx7-like isoform X2 [Varroa destructor]|uniref:Innexin n=1 Tax=Varroa destructor TaxID=109461 RepID=A0A7M7KBS8_VARDE|nr:innexin inx7-like isoform X2 [Varroa destructor]
MSRLDGVLFSAVRYFQPKSDYTTDTVLSAIHYKLAFGVILACAILTGVTSWYSPIECMRPDNLMIDSSLLKQWCYAQSMFIVDGPSAEENIFPGVKNIYGDSRNRVVYIRYYQWVTLCLLMQAACFQVPRILWKAMEGGRVQKLLERLYELETMPMNEREPRISELALLFTLRPECDNKRYVNWFIFSQILYFINAVAQVSLTQSFLDNQFITLFPKWVMGKPVLDAVFPKTAKCTLHAYGPTGDIQYINALCLLAMNVLIEKIYLLLWAVLMFSLVVSALQIIYVTVSMTSWRLRNAILSTGKSRTQMKLLKESGPRSILN